LAGGAMTKLLRRHLNCVSLKTEHPIFKYLTATIYSFKKIMGQNQ